MSDNYKHTPLPWHIDADHFIYGDNGTIVCDPRCPKDIDTQEKDANADLIVRAANCHADLLAACKVALTPLDALADGRPEDAKRFIKRAAAVVAYAIAKAEGQA